MTCVTTEAVVLHAFDYLETSRILRLATRDVGIVSTLARGARRSRRRFGAALDLFAGGTAEIQFRAGRELQSLLSFDVASPRADLALDLDRFLSASMLSELVLKCGTAEYDGPLFDVFVVSLDRLRSVASGEARLVGLGAAWQLTAALGFAPSLDQCTSCHGDIDMDLATTFSPSAGGMLCTACRGDSAGRMLPPVARAAIAAWLGGLQVPSGGSPMDLAHARLLAEFVGHHLAGHAELKAIHAWLARFRGASSGAGAAAA